MAKRASAVLTPAYDLETGEEIVDPVTVETIVRGQRKVASTPLERIEAVRKMVRYGHGVRDIASHIGCSIEDAYKVIYAAGFLVEADPMYRKSDGSDGNRLRIRSAGS